MDASEFELPDPCSPGCGLMQECWEAAGVWTTTPDAHPAPPAEHD